jgi:N-formylmaleamate deformylase
MSGWLSADVTANGIRLHYHRTGGDKPALVLSHGVTDDGLCWTPLARALEAQFDIIMVDARGHGGSETPVNGFSLDQQAADLAGLVRALGLHRPILGGSSMGAVTSLQVAAAYPDLVRAVFLEDPPLDALLEAPDQPSAARKDFADRMKPWLAGLKAMSQEQVMERCKRENPGWSAEEIELWAESKHNARVDFHSLAPPRLAWQEALARISCPILLMAGNVERGGVLTQKEVAEARRRLPGLHVVSFPHAGHCMSRDDFDGYLREVRGFLDRVSGT